MANSSPDRSVERDWISRPYTPADEEEILDLCLRVFGTEMSPELWTWQFPENPFAKAVVQVAEDRAGKIIGHYSQVPVPLWRDGKSQLGSYSILSMIDPLHQRKGILKQLAADAEKRLVDQKIMTGATFLNENSYPVYTRQLGWTEVYEKLPVMFLLFDVSPVASRYVGRALAAVASFFAEPVRRLYFRGGGAGSPSITVRRSTSIDPEVDGLWSQIRSGVRYSTDRTAAYLSWRVEKNPREYQIYEAKEARELAGIAVTRVDNKFGQKIAYLVELIVQPGRADVARALLQMALMDLRREQCGLITALAPFAGGQREILRRCGFRPLPSLLSPHAIHFCVKDRHHDGNQAALADPSGWWVSWSDHDVV